MLAWRAALSAALVSVAAVPAGAQTYPESQITIVVPFAAGGPTDLVARVLAEKLAPRLAQAVIVENRVGAGGDAGGQAVAKAAPDGYTLLMSTTGSLTVSDGLQVASRCSSAQGIHHRGEATPALRHG